MANGNQALPVGFYALGQPRNAHAGGLTRTASDSITAGGWTLFVIGLSIAGSAFNAMRLDVFGLSLHPVLVTIMLVGPLVLLTRIHEFPTKVLAGLLVFTAMYSFSNIGTLRLSTETLKVGAITLTILTSALLVRTPADFRVAVLGLMLSTLVISIRSLQGNELDSVHGAIESGHKNTLSLYLLPGLLLAFYLVLQKQEVGKLLKVILIPCILMTVTATFMSGNRSGWVGAGLIAAMVLICSRRFVAFLLVALVAGGAYYYMTNIGTTAGFDWAMEKTLAGNESDNLRSQLFTTAVGIGFENPLLGVSPERLPYELQRRLPMGDEAHNVIGHLAGASGLICLAAFLYVGWACWRMQPSAPISTRAEQQFRQARILLRMMVLLWLVRGQFTHEIIYSPTFGLGLGLAIGYVLQIVQRGAIGRALAPGVT